MDFYMEKEDYIGIGIRVLIMKLIGYATTDIQQRTVKLAVNIHINGQAVFHTDKVKYGVKINLFIKNEEAVYSAFGHLYCMMSFYKGTMKSFRMNLTCILLASHVNLQIWFHSSHTRFS